MMDYLWCSDMCDSDLVESDEIKNVLKDFNGEDLSITNKTQRVNRNQIEKWMGFVVNGKYGSQYKITTPKEGIVRIFNGSIVGFDLKSIDGEIE